MNTVVAKVKEFFYTRQILLLLLSAVLVATLTTAVGVKLYNMSDVSRLDLSLPGHEKSRKDVGIEEQIKFEANGSIDSKVLDDFQKLFDEKRSSLKALHKFDGDLLNSDKLKITTNE